ncbi:Mov34/MPN/PAD-1 family protein [Peribacillus deserti]|uniref:JAB domain-containing protein n=1 Tax=Peribacillus deserti TaxID=673318 RepID=A0A2N5M4K6_9BACI|nr:Mov34/MPN/PAD-1 family protein [Peribacillus deserti]PLT29290.1 hypothetical protein CUU66_14090 [Peribacillus deserti]
MNFNINPLGVIKISDNVLSKFQQYYQTEKGDSEAGGVLMGRFIRFSHDVVVDHITTPMNRDIRKRCFFKKNRDDHQKVIQAIWEESKGTCNYLGEWHTHPERHPTPSGHDIKEWKRVLRNTKCDSNELFFVIVGTESIGVWVGFRTNLELQKLTRS